MLRVTVIGEGIDEHGLLNQLPDRKVASRRHRLGSLGSLVRRILTERLGAECQFVGWSSVDQTYQRRIGPPPSPRETITNENYLPRFLLRLVSPARADPPTDPPVDMVVVSVDSEYRREFARTWQRTQRSYPDLAAPVVPVVWTPELEVLFVQSKEPLERAASIPVCQSAPPSTRGDLKTSLETWLGTYARGQALDNDFREKMALYLPVGPGSPLEAIPEFKQLVDRLSELAAAAAAPQNLGE